MSKARAATLGADAEVPKKRRPPVSLEGSNFDADDPKKLLIELFEENKSSVETMVWNERSSE